MYFKRMSILPPEVKSILLFTEMKFQGREGGEPGGTDGERKDSYIPL